ncbi:hypothetical protein FA95DRAFT_1558689 [Auriscalpium vulgare]|uniref:Uncharacterized protein n=1 Tax=Auriscalpium vulgare TaxID=40419 RepID=A0ACB8RVH8_9AGAM|nr:hypothetical protein FA95DRAFT_1558689 [Auriscalpium vulgare]
MDELVSHCLREISFDGDLGCDISRLRDFITNFYIRRQVAQTVDDAYLAFAWGLIVGHPTVRVGLIPPGITTEVYIAPQTSKKRKAKAEAGEADNSAHVSELLIVADAHIHTLEELRTRYGDELRIAVDPETAFAAITGSHTRPAKLSPMVYTALQFIARARQDGISIVDIGKKSGYDQKSCFYLIKQLLELDLVVKLRRGGVGANFCVLKYFFDHDPLWKQIREEAAQPAEEEPQAPEEAAQPEENTENGTPAASVQFEPIDARHLSSLPLVEARIVKLLKNSEYFIHPSQNLLVTIGFTNPTKTDRRFFQNRLRDLVDKGVVERVSVPSAGKRSANSTIPCIRLVTDAGSTAEPPTAVQVAPPDEPAVDDDLTSDLPERIYGLKANVTLHKQMIDLLEASGTAGLTLNQLSEALGNFDRRTLELLLTRLEKFPPPSHLSDLGVAQMMENFGRERRYRYYTLAHYRAVVVRDQLDDSSGAYAKVDFSKVGQFAPVSAGEFYEEVEARDKFVDELKMTGEHAVKRALKAAKVKSAYQKRGKKRKREDGEEGGNDAAGQAEMEAPPAKKKRGRTRKVTLPEDTVADPSSSTQPPAPADEPKRPPAKKLGRPRKHPIVDDGNADGDALASTTTPKKRGRPTKAKPPPDGNDASAAPAVPKKRGRPRKSAPPVVEPTAVTETEVEHDELASDSENMEVDERRVFPQIPVDPQLRTGVGFAADPRPPPSQPTSPTTLAEAIEAVTANEPESTRRSKRVTKAVVRQDFVPSSKPRTPQRTPHKSLPAAAVQVVQSSGEVLGSPADTPQRNVGDAVVQTSEGNVSIQSIAALPDASANASSTMEVPIDPSLLTEEVGALLTADNVAVVPAPLSAAVDQPAGDKRPASDSPVPEPAHKRQRLEDKSKGGRPKGNMSLLRRENELLRVLEEVQGIANTSSKDFSDVHLALLDKMTAAGELTSGPPGTRIDRRTMDSTLDSMETRGKIKLVRTSISSLTGTQRQVRIAYLPHIEQAQVDEVLTQLAQKPTHPQPPPSTPMKTILVNIPRAAAPKASRVPPKPLRLMQREKPSEGLEHWNRNKERADQLFEYDDKAIREMLLTERNTVSQSYGFISGKAIRTREFQVLLLGAFAEEVTSPSVVSKEHRIVHTSHFQEYVTVETFCSLVACLSVDDDLTAILRNEGRRTLLKDLPESIQNSLQLGRARVRGRVTDFLDLLHGLGVVTPLTETSSATAAIQCAPKLDWPTSFEIYRKPVEPGGSAAPVYWQLHKSAPMYLWILSHDDPPFWKNMPITTPEEVKAYWDILERASRDGDFCMANLLRTTEIPVRPPELRVWPSIRRKTAWISEYELSWYQRRYLKKFVSFPDGDTPLQDPDGGPAALEKICWVVSAPLDVVRDFFEHTRTKQKADIEKSRARMAKKASEDREKRFAEEKALLNAKVASAKVQRENDWEELVRRVHAQPLKGSAATRVNRIRSRYLGSGTLGEVSRWETEVRQAIQDANIARHQVLPAVIRPPPRPGTAAPIPVVTRPFGKSIEQLIEEQRPLRNPELPKKRKKKGKAKDGAAENDESPADAEKTPGRRHRFQWNTEYDELAQDACVVLRARARTLPRMDWSALEQVFPGVPKNSIRLRFAGQREHHSTETYLRRLEERWYSLWMQHRGTEHLPDDDLQSMNNFDLVKHVEFLRHHIDKNALRVGDGESHDAVSLSIPADVSVLERDWKVTSKPAQAPMWDFIWNLTVDDGREKGLLANAFTTDSDEIPPAFDECPDSIRIAESALKMVFGTPNERYDPIKGSALLHSAGEEAVSIARTNLLSRGVLSKLVRDHHKPKPGRTLKISEVNQNAIGGSIPRDTFQDAAALELLSRDQEETQREWPLLASDGDLAMLVQATSDAKISFVVDTAHAGTVRAGLDWNSKKADDDDIETKISVSFADLSEPSETEEQTPPLPSPTPVIEHEEMSEHGKTAQGAAACCKALSDGVIDCQGCLEAEMATVIAARSPRDQDIIREIWAALDTAGATGLQRQVLVKQLAGHDEGAILSMLEQLLDATTPLVICTGYASVVFVAASHAQAWTVPVADEPPVRIFPRRWLDIGGLKISEIWDAAQRAVIGAILFRPGISQSEIRWRLRSVYDRQEVGEVLRSLHEEGYVKRRLGPVLHFPESMALPLDDEEEKNVHWFLGERRWYQVS